jgi:hypothetical protein
VAGFGRIYRICGETIPFEVLYVQYKWWAEVCSNNPGSGEKGCYR